MSTWWERLVAFGMFMALAMTFCGGWLMAEEQMQSREKAVADMQAVWEARVSMTEEAYIEAKMEAGRWKDEARDMADRYLADHERRAGMICIEQALTPTFVPKQE